MIFKLRYQVKTQFSVLRFCAFNNPSFIDQARDDLKMLWEVENGKNYSKAIVLEFYDDQEEFLTLLCQILGLNPHSTFVLKAHSKEQLYGIELDHVNVLYSLDTDKKDIKVVKILSLADSTDYLQTRSKAWLAG